MAALNSPKNVADFVADVRYIIAQSAPDVPPHAITKKEIVAAFYDGYGRREIAGELIRDYRGD